MEKNTLLEELWEKQFEQFIVTQDAYGNQDPCGGSTGGMPPA